MLHRLLHLLENTNLMNNDPNWRETLKRKNITKAKIAGVIFAAVFVLCIIIRIFT